MPGLGLFGGAPAVPSGALNVEDGGIRPFDQLEKFELGKIDILTNKMVSSIYFLGYFNCGVLRNEDSPFIINMDLDQ